jgi:hypothetical protein
MRIYVHAHYWSETYLNTHERYGKPNIEAQRGMARSCTRIGAVSCRCTAFLPQLYVQVGRND